MQVEPIELQVDIERSPQDVFDYIRDFSHSSEWQPDALEVTPDAAGPAKAGTRVHMKRRTPFGAQSFTVEVTDMDEAARTMKDTATDGAFQGTTTEWAVDDVGGKSRLRIKMTPEVHGAAASFLRIGFARRKMVQSMSHTWSQNLERLSTSLGKASS
jgi:uncharacterized protein YndB with AHSA1/START domain